MKRIENPLDMNTVTLHRREECIHYASCLEEASAMLWPSFSCAGCKQYAEAEAPSRPTTGPPHPWPGSSDAPTGPSPARLTRPTIPAQNGPHIDPCPRKAVTR